MASIILFGTRGSPYVEKVARALGLKGMAFELQDMKSPTEDRVSAADLAVHGELHLGASGSTPDFEDLVAKRPALGARSRRVEDVAKA